MQYMLLIYSDPAQALRPGDAGFEEEMGRYLSLGERMAHRAKVLAGEGLKDVATATSVRVKGGRVETMDGPFAETREHLGGFYLIDCASLDDALAFAAEIPAAARGTVEVRPVMDY